METVKKDQKKPSTAKVNKKVVTSQKKKTKLKTEVLGANESKLDVSKLLVELKKQFNVLKEIYPSPEVLSDKDRHYLTRPAKERWSFVEAAISAAQDNENLLPRDVTPDQLEQDMEDYHILKAFCQDLAAFRRLLDDRRILLGNKLLLLANGVYDSAESQQKRKVPNASSVVEYLKKQKTSRKKRDAAVVEKAEHDFPAYE
jgi:hypothetical protein